MPNSPEIHIIPAIAHNHNYIYVFHDEETGETAAIDVGDHQPVLDFLEEKGWGLTHVLTTHHHWDHTDGNLAIKQETDCVIAGFAGDAERIKGIDIKLEDGASITVCGMNFKVMHVPGHTLGAICYYCEQENIIFTGDTLFTMGCGRMFEGDAAMMYQSLQKIAKLPPETKIYSGHEYAVSNAKFAMHVDPENKAVAKRLEVASKNVENSIPNQPSIVADERATNPFLRCGDENIRIKTGMNHARDEEVFGYLRKTKDKF